MGNIFRRFVSIFFRNSSLLLLLLIWFLGLLLGSFLTAALGESFFLLMRTAASSRVSIVGLIASSYLPFLFSAFAVYIGKPKLLYLCCFVKALLFASCAYASLTAFQSAGWLVRCLLQFSDILLVPALCWFSIQQVSGEGSLRRDFSFCTVLFLLAGSLDYCVVSPFLVMLIAN